MTSARGLLRMILLLTLALSLAGCGDSLLGPNTPPENTGDPGGNTGGNETQAGPEILMITEDQTVRFMKLAVQSVDETAEPATSRAIRVSAVIDGEAGGQLQCGRFLLAVPPGAFQGEGTVSMSMADETVMIVDVEISPAELNDFDVPVKLCLLTDGTGLAEEDLQIYWWDPDKSEWKAMGCDRDLSDDTTITGTAEGLLTHLSHFSRYSGGKAGW
jgi:predicted small lipoprotein YifL